MVNRISKIRIAGRGAGAMQPAAEVQKNGLLKYYSPKKKQIVKRWCVLKGLSFHLWESEKAWKQGKPAVDVAVLSWKTRVEPIGKKMGKAFCIRVATDGLDQGFWAANTDEQNAWIEALRAACKPPEQPKVDTSSTNNSDQHIQIQVGMPAGQAGPDPQAAFYQQQLMMQQQYYQQQLMAMQQQLQMQQMQMQQQALQPPIITTSATTLSRSSDFNANGAVPMMPMTSPMPMGSPSPAFGVSPAMGMSPAISPGGLSPAMSPAMSPALTAQPVFAAAPGAPGSRNSMSYPSNSPGLLVPASPQPAPLGRNSFSSPTSAVSPAAPQNNVYAAMYGSTTATTSPAVSSAPAGEPTAAPVHMTPYGAF